MGHYDVIVLGAGINGSGIAHQLTLEGHQVLLLDRIAAAAGTSSRSSRLIHGGLRYLETRQFRLVREALLDRERLAKRYPDLVHFVPFYVPVYADSPRPAWMIRLGLQLYDLLAAGHKPFASSRVHLADFQARFPVFRSEGLRQVFTYPDARTNDAELTRRVVKDFQADGGTFLSPLDVQAVNWDQEGVTIRTNSGDHHAAHLVNATGPWIDEVNQTFDLPANYHIRKVSGIHIFLPRILVPELLFLQTSSHRIFFVIPDPDSGQTMIGTTEREEEGDMDSVVIHSADIDYLLDSLNAYLKPEARLTRSDVLNTVVGVRALVQHRGDPTDLSREYRLDLHRQGESKLLHVFGGKLTTFLSLAEHAVETLDLPARD